MFYVSPYSGVWSTYTNRSAENKHYVQSIFTDYMDAAIVVFELDFDDSKIIPVLHWVLSKDESDVVQGLLSVSKQMPEKAYRETIINADTLDSSEKPTSSYRDVFYASDVCIYVQDTFTPLTGLTWLKQREQHSQINWSQFSMRERLQVEIERLFAQKEDPSVFVMAFLQGIIYLRHQISLI